MEKKVSVIIPVYNREAFLSRCLDSICQQTYKNMEIICINDGSSDDSGRILDKIALSDNRLKIIHQTNSGAAAARNVGLDIVSGEYILMVDADDYVELDMIHKMVELADYSSADLVITGVSRIRKEGKRFNEQPKMLPGLHTAKLSDFFVNFSPAPHAKLYKTSIIKEHNLSFPFGVVMGEDSVFNAVYWHYVKNVYFLKEALYVYDESNTLSATSKFVAGQLPFSVYAQTLALPCTIYDELSKRQDGVKTLSEWIPCLLKMQLIEHGWVMDVVFSDVSAKAKLNVISKNCYKQLAQHLTLYYRIKLNVPYRVAWLKGRMMRLAGIVKRFVLGRLSLNK